MATALRLGWGLSWFHGAGVSAAVGGPSLGLRNRSGWLIPALFCCQGSSVNLIGVVRPDLARFCAGVQASGLRSGR